MHIKYTMLISCFAMGVMFASPVFAQDAAEPHKEPVAEDAKKEMAPAVKTTDAKPETTKAQPAKKMVQDATIYLQTTITGNQEQPRVLYILPWQAPLTTSVDFEPLDSQQKAIFNHVEREELRRELESAGELQ